MLSSIKKKNIRCIILQYDKLWIKKVLISNLNDYYNFYSIIRILEERIIFKNDYFPLKSKCDLLE